MNPSCNYEDFLAQESSKDAKLNLLFKDFTSISHLEKPEEYITSFFSIYSIFYIPLEQQDNFLSRIFQKLSFIQSKKDDSIDSLLSSFSFFFKDHSNFICKFLSVQFIEIFRDTSAGLRLKNQFLKYPQLSLSDYKTDKSLLSALILLFYPTPFLISADQFITLLIDQEFHNCSINLLQFIQQETQIIISLSNHLLPLELSHEFRTNLLPYFIQKKLIEHISYNLYPLLIQHPDSSIRIDEFTALLKGNLSNPSFDHFQYESISRLLHPGSNTTQILAYYLSAIQAIQTLTPPYFATELISSVIFAYLKGREDTFRCIISTFLTRNNSTQTLHNEIEGSKDFQGRHESKQFHSFFKGPHSHVPSTEDIVGIFTNIYGSKELFILEYRNLLADRILSKFDFDLVTEFSNLAKLESKFGGSYFTNCQVMLKDVAYSLKFQINVHSNLENSTNQLVCYILSHNFWPPFMDENLLIPLEDLKSIFLRIKSLFETSKPRRTIEWKTHIGLVELEVSLDRKLRCFFVSPMHAVILLHFKKRKAWLLKDMASMMKVSQF